MGQKRGYFEANSLTQRPDRFESIENYFIYLFKTSLSIKKKPHTKMLKMV